MSATFLPEGRTTRWSISLGLVILLLLGLGWWLLDTGRDGGAAGSDGTVILAQADEEEGEDDAETIELASIEVTYDFFLARDPFESIRPPEPVTAPSDPSDPTSPTQPTDPTSPTQPTDPSDPTSPTPPPGDDTTCTTGVEAVCDGIVVSLLDVDATTARIQVDQTTYDVEPGESFAQNFQLVRISGGCVDILYSNGDEAEVFRLCDGESVSK